MKYTIGNNKLQSMIAFYLDKFYGNISEEKKGDVIIYNTKNKKGIFILSDNKNFSISRNLIKNIQSNFKINSSDAAKFISNWAKIKLHLKNIEIIYN